MKAAKKAAEKESSASSSSSEDKVESVRRSSRSAAKGALVPVYEDEADEGEEDDVEATTPKKSKTTRSTSTNKSTFNYVKFAEVIAETFNDEEMSMMDIVFEYSIKKFKELKEKNVDMKKIQIRNPFVEKEEPVACVFASQQISQEFMYDNSY